MSNGNGPQETSGLTLVRNSLLFVASAGAAILAACGGGGGEPSIETAAATATDKPSVHALSASPPRPVTIYKLSGKVAIADFGELAADGCTLTFAQIIANGDGRGSDINVYGITYNQCTGSYDSFYAGGDPNSKVVINDHAASASGVLTGYFPDGSTKKVEINLKWIGGSAREDKTKTTNISPEVKLIARTTSSFRFADSVTGSFILDGDNHLSPSHNSSVNGYVAMSGGTVIEVVRP